jgi:tripartite-type tricarboxylate transporter receptor subunit TctC
MNISQSFRSSAAAPLDNPGRSSMPRFSIIAIVLICVACPAAALAQAYPAKPVRMVVGFVPGGGTDILGRVIGAKLTELWGQQVVIENRPGATGTIGADFVAKAPPDGYTLLLGSVNSHAIAPSVFRKLPYDPVKDFSSIAYVCYTSNIFVVHPSLPVRTVKDVIALAKAKPGQLSSASAGPGSVQHLALETFKVYTGVNIVHIPYKGSGQAVLDLIAGNVQMNFDVVPPIIEHIRRERLRPLAATTLKRASQLPEIPTLDEVGLKGFDVANWWAVFGPPGMPKEIVTKLNNDLNKVLQDPVIRKRLTESGYEFNPPGTAESLEAYVRAEVAKYAKVAKVAGMQVD